MDVVQHYALSRRNLIPSLLISGLILILIVGLITSAIAIYSTFRVAGPLYHFTRDLERQIEEGPLPVERIREGDLLQKECFHLARSAEHLQAYYDAMSELIDLAWMQLTLQDPNMGGGLQKNLDRLRELERLVRF
ncbi:MAG: hypothetical protein H7832_08625 [Magnetococcus sp. DMHC-6]